MKNIVLLFFMCSLSCLCQDNCGNILYKVTGTYDIIYYTMRFSNKYSYYEETKIQKESEKIEVLKENSNLIKNVTIQKQSLKPMFFFNDRKELYFLTEYVSGKTDIVKETNIKWDWKILPDEKKIGNFTVQKTTAKFRGSSFTAWFTNKIPLPYGPWKAKDLPGIILEIYDDNNLLHITAIKVSLTGENCKNPIDKKIFTNSIDMYTFLKKQKLEDIDFIKKLNAKLPKSAKKFNVNEDCDDCPKQLKLENFEEKF